MPKTNICLILIFFLGINIVLADRTEDHLARDIYNHILSLKKENRYELIPSAIDHLCAFRNSTAQKLLIDLLDFYLGEGGGEVLLCCITRQGDAVLPFLRKKLKGVPIGDMDKWKEIRDRNICYLIEAIRHKVVISVDLPLSELEEVRFRLFTNKLRLEEYKVKFGKYPSKLELVEKELPPSTEHIYTIDPWGQFFFYEVKDDGHAYTMFSSGHDKKPNTKDDIKLEYYGEPEPLCSPLYSLP